jgi:hypothetical protein
MSNYQPLHRYDHFKISTCYRIFTNLNSFYHLGTHHSYSVFVNTTPVDCLIHFTRQVKERERERNIRHCPTCWIGRSVPQASLRSHQISRSLTTSCVRKQWGHETPAEVARQVKYRSELHSAVTAWGRSEEIIWKQRIVNWYLSFVMLSEI